MSRPFWPVMAALALSLCAGAVTVPSGAQAADLPARMAPPPPPPAVLPVFTWTGFYVGVQGGYEAASSQLNELVSSLGVQRTTNPVGFGPGTPYIYRYSPDGFVGGGHVGANYQVQSFVIGIEGDVEGSTTGGGFVDNIAVPAQGKAHDQIPWRASVRGRLGYAFNNVLFFATGGVAFAEVRSTYTRFAFAPPVQSAAETLSKTTTGWTVGAGLDYALSEHWIVSGLYRHTDYGRIRNVSLVAFPGITARTHVETDSGEIGVSYKF